MKKVFLIGIFIINVFLLSTAYADEPSRAVNNFEVSGVQYSTLKDAYDAITSSSGTIKVLDNCTDNSILTISSEKKITINVNGKVLSRTERGITNEGTLIISGTGTLKASDDVQYLISNRGSLSITNTTLLHEGNETKQWAVIYSTSGNITLNSGAIECGTTNTSALDQTHFAMSIRGETSALIKDGQITSTGEKGYCISVQANSYTPTATGTITISGGTIESTDGTAIIFGANEGYECETDLSMSSGTVKGKVYGIRASSEGTKSNITITGGSIISTGSESSNRGIFNSGIGTITIGTRGKALTVTTPLMGLLIL